MDVIIFRPSVDAQRIKRRVSRRHCCNNTEVRARAIVDPSAGVELCGRFVEPGKQRVM